MLRYQNRKLNIIITTKKITSITARIIHKIIPFDYFQQAIIILFDYVVEDKCWIAWISFLLIIARIAKILFLLIDQPSHCWFKGIETND